MDHASLDDLEAQRERLYDQLAATGDFRRGSISENYRRCGKPNCACAAWLADLDAGDIETPVAETTPRTLGEDTARTTTKALAYFKTNAHRMRYAYFREHDMFIGSGTVEAGCKAVIAQRLKLSGMRWNIAGATGILTLRCQQASNRWDHICTHPHNQTATA
jgi:hypothetical protein